MHNKVLFQSRLFEDGDLTKLCQIVFGDLPECDSKGEQFSDCCVTVLRNFIIFSSADFSDGFGCSCAITKSLSLMVLIKRSTNPVALWSPTGLNITFMLCSRQNSLTSLEINQIPDSF